MSPKLRKKTLTESTTVDEPVYDNYLVESATIEEAVVDKDNEDILYIKGRFMYKSASENMVHYGKAQIDSIHESAVLGIKTNTIKVLKDHTYMADSTIGAVIENDRQGDQLFYRAKILKDADPITFKKIKEGILTSVSPGMKYDKLQCSICKERFPFCEHTLGEEYNGKKALIEPVNPRLKEISIVPVPGLINATVTVESLLKRKLLNEKVDQDNSDVNMTNDTEKDKEITLLKETVSKLETEKKALEKQIDSLTKDNEQLTETVKDYVSKQHETLVDEIITEEQKKGVLEDKEVRSKELKEMSVEQLETTLKVYRRFKKSTNAGKPNYPVTESLSSKENSLKDHPIFSRIKGFGEDNE